MKTIKTLITFAALAVVAISCQRDEAPVSATSDNPATIIATINNDATRATFADNQEGGVALTWEAGDEIMLYDSNGGYIATFVTAQGGDYTAEFTHSSGATPTNGNYTAVYPAYYVSPGVPAPTLAYRTNALHGQKQSGNGDTSHLDALSYMKGTLSYSTSAPVSNAVNFYMEFALLTVKIATPTDYIGGTHGAPTALTFYNGNKASSTLFIEGITTADDLTLYMVIEPYSNPATTPDEERSLRFELITENWFFEKEITEVSKEYQAGKRYTADLTDSDKLENTGWVGTMAEFSALLGTQLRGTMMVTDAISGDNSYSVGRKIHSARNNSGNIKLILPAVTTVKAFAFSQCSKLLSVNFPVATTIEEQGLFACNMMQSISLPAVISIGTYALSENASLTSVNLPAMTTIESNAFYNCNNLISVNFPAATTIGESVFRDCSNLTSVSLPAAETIASRVFSGCTDLTTIEIGGVTQMTSVAYTELFSNAPDLSNIHLIIGAGEVTYYGTTLGPGGYWRGYGPFANVSQR